MGFFRLLGSSIYDPGFYGRIAEKKAGSAFGYFALLMLLSSIALSIGTIREISAVIFQPSEEKQSIVSAFQDIYPEELAVTINNGIVSTNVEEPYAIPLPESFEEDSASHEEDLPMNIIVIDTENPITEDSFRSYQTMAILGKDSIGFYDAKKGKVEIQSLNDMSDTSFTLDKTTYDSFIETGVEWLKYIGVAMLFLIPLFFFFAILPFNLLYLLFGAIVVWIVAKVRGENWNYGTAYKASLYLITTPMIYGIISTYVPQLDVFFVFTIILAGITAINIAKKTKEPEVVAPAPTTRTPEPEAA